MILQILIDSKMWKLAGGCSPGTHLGDVARASPTTQDDFISLCSSEYSHKTFLFI